MPGEGARGAGAGREGRTPCQPKVQMPTDVQQFINAIKIAVSFGVKLILEMTPLACLGLGGYSAEMLSWIIAPFWASRVVSLSALHVGSVLASRH